MNSNPYVDFNMVLYLQIDERNTNDVKKRDFKRKDLINGILKLIIMEAYKNLQHQSTKK